MHSFSTAVAPVLPEYSPCLTLPASSQRRSFQDSSQPNPPSPPLCPVHPPPFSTVRRLSRVLRRIWQAWAIPKLEDFVGVLSSLSQTWIISRYTSADILSSVSEVGPFWEQPGVLTRLYRKREGNITATHMTRDIIDKYNFRLAFVVWKFKV